MDVKNILEIVFAEFLS